MKRHRLFAAIVLSGLAASRCGAEIEARDAAADDATTDDADGNDANATFPDAAYDGFAAPDSDAAVDAFTHPPIITN